MVYPADEQQPTTGGGAFGQRTMQFVFALPIDWPHGKIAVVKCPPKADPRMDHVDLSGRHTRLLYHAPGEPAAHRDDTGGARDLMFDLSKLKAVAPRAASQRARRDGLHLMLRKGPVLAPRPVLPGGRAQPA